MQDNAFRQFYLFLILVADDVRQTKFASSVVNLFDHANLFSFYFTW